METHIYSFSYSRTGIPPDQWGHGGGFVFDCRLLPNPGREAKFASLTGRDEETRKYLEARPLVGRFLRGVAGVVDLAQAEYLTRGYQHLSVAFGCTGGQHRSVYCAEWLRAHLERAGRRVTLEHLNVPPESSPAGV